MLPQKTVSSMGNTSSTSTVLQFPQPKRSKSNPNEVIVWGYIRDIQYLLSSNALIPEDLIAIVYAYYKAANRYLLIWSGALRKNNEKCNKISFIAVSNDNNNLEPKTYALNVKDLTDLNSTKKHIISSDKFDRLHCGHSIASKVSIPQWFTKKYPIISPHFEYQMLIRVGGEYNTSGLGMVGCDIILFNNISLQQNISKYTLNDNDCIIDAYYASLPRLPSILDHTASIYHNNTIVVGGGTGGNSLNKLFELKFNDANEWKWRNNKRIQLDDRYGVKLCAIHDNNILIIGGFANSRACDIVNLYSVGCQDKMDGISSSISNMTMGRYKPGCYYDITRQRVFVGGGYNALYPAKRSLEFCDLNSNKWIKIENQTIRNHMFSPLVWIDDANRDIFYIAGREIGNHGYSFLDDIECLDLRNNNGWMKYKSLSSMFDIGKDFIDSWRSRALLSFTV